MTMKVAVDSLIQVQQGMDAGRQVGQALSKLEAKVEEISQMRATKLDAIQEQLGQIKVHMAQRDTAS